MKNNASATPKTAKNKKSPRRNTAKRSPKSAFPAKEISIPQGSFILLVVESPAKAKTIRGYLGSKFFVTASFGHIIDLPSNELGVDVENKFAPRFTIIAGREKIAEQIKKAAKQATQIMLATDPDREGESIAWHIANLVRASRRDSNIRRITFNAITKESIQNALQNPRDIDHALVESQIARRIVDRLVGYLLSRRLWDIFRQNNLSAGRVQSVALRIVVERERAISAFKPSPYWVFTGEFIRTRDQKKFYAQLVELEGSPVKITDEASAKRVVDFLKTLRYNVKARDDKKVSRNPPPPFITSSLQQASSRLLKLDPEKTMQHAQTLYEGVVINGQRVGLITYMRTDSPRVAPEAQAQARAWIEKHLGAEYLPKQPPNYQARNNAQDAHEAIRPTSVERQPDLLENQAEWSKPLPDLYGLIWRRFMASQAAPALYAVTSVKIEGRQGQTSKAVFLVQGRKLLFPGFLRLYPEHNEETAMRANEESQTSEEHAAPPYQDDLPDLHPQDEVQLIAVTAEQRWTKAPPRFSEASLVSALERQGIGRPSTYASIIQRLKDRQYVTVQKGTLRPTPLGEKVCDYLVEHFSQFMDIKYTAHLEDELDRVASGAVNRIAVLQRVYDDLQQLLKKT